MNFNKFIGAGVALASSTLVFGSTMSAPAQAYTLSSGDTVNFTGAASYSPTTLTFLGQGTVANFTTTGGFADAGLIGTAVNVSNINIAGVNSTTTNPFATFANGLKFAVTNPFSVITTPQGAFTDVTALFKGKFYDGSTVVGDGFLTANIFNRAGQGSYSATIAVVPEPFTILGTATALGFGAFLKSKKKKEDQVSA
jgi:hypothetical protein